MKVFNAILGVYAVFNALYCIFWPEASVLGIGWIIAILLALYGISSISEYFFSNKKIKGLATGGSIQLGLGIAAIIASILAMSSDVMAGVLSIVVILCLSFGIAAIGVIELVDKKKRKGRGWMIAAGIFHLAAGIFGALSVGLLSISVSLALGIMLMIIGVAEFSRLFGFDSTQDESEFW